jgi:hypothetical protein
VLCLPPHTHTHTRTETRKKEDEVRKITKRKEAKESGACGKGGGEGSLYDGDLITAEANGNNNSKEV